MGYNPHLIAAAVLHLVFGDAMRAFEAGNGITRGAPGSEASAMVFAEYFPNPGGKALTDPARDRMTFPVAFAAEVIGTAVLVLLIFCVTDERNKARPAILTPATIGLTVTLLISLLGPLTMACFNPARDLAPRIFSSLAGWGSVPFQVNGHGWLTVYVVAHCIGALVGGGIHRCLFRNAPSSAPRWETSRADTNSLFICRMTGAPPIRFCTIQSTTWHHSRKS